MGARMKSVPGDGLLPVGGSELAVSVLQLGLLGELRVIWTPSLLGAGRTLFDGIQRRHALKLLSTQGFKPGYLVAVYERLRI